MARTVDESASWGHVSMTVGEHDVTVYVYSRNDQPSYQITCWCEDSVTQQQVFDALSQVGAIKIEGGMD